MKFGEMKHEIDVIQEKGQNIFGKWNKTVLTKEGERIFKNHPE